MHVVSRHYFWINSLHRNTHQIHGRSIGKGLRVHIVKGTLHIVLGGTASGRQSCEGEASLPGLRMKGNMFINEGSYRNTGELLNLLFGLQNLNVLCLPHVTH